MLGFIRRLFGRRRERVKVTQATPPLTPLPKPRKPKRVYREWPKRKRPGGRRQRQRRRAKAVIVHTSVRMHKPTGVKLAYHGGYDAEGRRKPDVMR